MPPTALDSPTGSLDKPLWTVGPLPLVALAIFVPGHMAGWAVEWGWLALQIFAGSLVLLSNQGQLRDAAGVPVMLWVTTFILLTLTGCLSALYGNAALGIRLDNSDAVDLLRFLVFIPLVLFITSLRAQHLEGFLRMLKLCIALHLVCSVILVLEIEPLASWVLVIYSEAKVQYSLHHIRIGIPFVNPNFAALLFVLMLSIFLFYARSALFAGLCLVAIVLTGSRSGYIAAAPLILLAYIIFLFGVTTSWRRGVVVVVAHATALWFFSQLAEAFTGFSRIVEFTEALADRDLGQVNTASIRFDVIENALRFIEVSPLIGVGPGRALGLDIVDSQIVAWPLAYGIPAAVLLYGLFLGPMVVLFVRCRLWVHRLACVATALSFFLMLGTGDFMKNYRLFFLSLVLMHFMHLAVARSSVPGSRDRRPEITAAD